MPIHKIIEEILATPMDSCDIAYVSANGTWKIGKNGCQPSHTFAIGKDDLENLAEVEEQLSDWMDTYTYREEI